MTLRTRLALAFGIVLAVLASLAVVLPHLVRTAQLDQVDRQLERTVPVAWRASADPAQASQTAAPPAAASGAPPGGPATNDIYVATIEGGQRNEVFGTLTLGDRAPEEPDVVSAFREDPVLQTVGSEAGSGTWRAALVQASDGTLVLIAIPLDSIESTAQRINTILLVAGVVALLVVLAAGWWVFRLGLRPIREVTGVAAAYSAGERGRRVAELGGRTEAGQLARTFNEMLDEQQAAEERLRRFVADASHELRTPVSAIGGFADLYRNGAVGSEQLDDVMRRIGQESARMRDLVQDMLLLAQLDEHRDTQRTSADLSAVVRDAALDASGSHPSRRVEVMVPTAVPVHAAESRLRQVVANLLENALVHTNGDVTLSVAGQDGTARLVVADQGPGLDQASVERMFDRFWRGDRAPRGTGSGLGMPIVRGIVESEGGTVEVDSIPDRGTTVTVTLPRADQA